jgi:tRNA-binding protein
MSTSERSGGGPSRPGADRENGATGSTTGAAGAPAPETPQPSVWEAFAAVEIRVGTVREALPFPEARTPAIKLRIDFGGGDVRWSSAQLTARYSAEELPGRQVLAVTNLPPKRVAGFKSECLTLGVPDETGAVVLIAPDTAVPEGGRLY